MAGETEQKELRGLVCQFLTGGFSDTARRELADLIDRAYISKIIERDEYQSMMAAVR